LSFAHPAAFFCAGPGPPVYLLYLDDSGSVGNASETHFVLGGVSVFERQVHFLTEMLGKVAEKYSPTDPEGTELHASDIFSSRKPPWTSLRKPKERQDALKEVLSVLANDTYGAQAFAVAVHKKSFPNDDAMEIAFEELCSRFDIYLKNRNASRPDDERPYVHKGMIVLDTSTYESTLQKRARHFKKFGTKWGTTKNIPEVPLFVDSQHCRLIQLADHVAYSVFRYYESKDMNYIHTILKKFQTERGDARLHGLVHKQTDDLSCMCHACMSRR
jgi:hypothetical protein